MPDKLERFIKFIYKKWKSDNLKKDEAHLDEEALVCFLEGRMTQEDSESGKTHLLNCDACAEVLAFCLSVNRNEDRKVPEDLLNRVRDFIPKETGDGFFEIALKVKDRVLEIINTTGDILVGNELVPAPLLRSRKMQDFKDEVTILRDFKEIRVQAKIENSGSGTFTLIILVKEKQTQKIIKDLRVTLLKDDLELGSYLTDTGSVTFEHVFLGKYKVEISSSDEKLASVLLDIRV